MSYSDLLEKFFVLLRLFLDGEEKHPSVRKWANECLQKQEVVQPPDMPKKFRSRGQMTSALGFGEDLFALATARHKVENLQNRLERALMEVKNLHDNAERHIGVIEEGGVIDAPHWTRVA